MSGPSERVYAGLVQLYPTRFRARYGAEMVQLFADQLRDARAGRGPMGFVGTWLRGIVDLVANAISEHARGEGGVGHSLATPPTPGMRLLGVVGVVGGLLLVAAFVSWFPFDDQGLNTLRIAWFCLGGAAVAIALHGRQAAVAPMLARVATGAVVAGGVSYAGWVTVSLVESPFSGILGQAFFYGGVALWLSAAGYGLALLRIDAAWRGVGARARNGMRMGAAALALGSPFAVLGIDRLGFVDDPAFGAQISAIAQVGAVVNGLGWILLGLGVALGGRSLGRAGLVGGVVAVVGLVTIGVPAVPALGLTSLDLFNLRLAILNLGAIAVVAALYRRLSARSRRLALLAAAPALVANALHLIAIVTVVASPGDPRWPWPYPLAIAAMFVTGAWFGLVALRLGVLPRWAVVPLMIGGVLAALPPLGVAAHIPAAWFDVRTVEEVVGWLALLGVGLYGIGWILLGGVIALPRQTGLNDSKA